RRTDEQQRRTDEQIARTSKEVAELSISGRRTDEQQRRTDEQIAKMSKEVAELSKNIGGVNRSLGRWTEQMVAAKLWEKFDAFEYEFTRGSRNIKFRDGKQIIAEADIFLENGDYAMPVEVKTDLIEEDIDDHLDRIGKIRLYMDKRGDKRLLVGAVAGAIVPESVCRYAQKKGLYVVVQSGDSVEVVGIPNGFEVRKW
ncbi:MAG: hypothetical protein LBF87_00065, partial [Treponema sp.]|nr:hypothetical protein [Treponema sp.]